MAVVFEKQKVIFGVIILLCFRDRLGWTNSYDLDEEMIDCRLGSMDVYWVGLYSSHLEVWVFFVRGWSICFLVLCLLGLEYPRTQLKLMYLGISEKPK